MLRLSGICKRFEDLPVLSNLSLTLSRGEIVALIGPSGCGKTTLLNIISGLTAPDAGTVEGADGRLSYMFQSARLLPWRTVEENIRLVREDAPAEEVRSLITAVGLEGFERYYPGQLSGGMARRCALARAFHFGGEIFLMDEPFQGLDYGIRMEMLSMLLSIWQRERFDLPGPEGRDASAPELARLRQEIIRRITGYNQSGCHGNGVPQGNVIY